MRQIRYDAYGPPDVLHCVSASDPEPAPGEVLVRVRAAALNSVDAQLRDGLIPGRGTPPFVPGLDVSGVVEALGSDVGGLSVGDPVIGYLSPGQGGYAEKVSAPATSFVPHPAAVDEIHAAALPLVGLTALQALDFADVSAGQRVLIHAAAGGVGHVAVQLAVARGAEVVATARPANHELITDLGAKQVIDYTTVDFGTAIDGVDVVLDLVGGDYGSRSLDVLAPGGRVLGLTLRPGDVARDAERRGLRYDFFGLHPSQDDLRRLVDHMNAGTLRTVVESTFALEDAAAAHRLLESRRVRGKVVLVP
ncbi:NADP-dependent oxidoreductase [Nocardia alni]|uniref:NADP-dependent oxidoreductase n=1 Tax=Nocardia alni TaxID=2815723 RepID=UPI001C21814C|nr:NADP-dependent oxidoreductase [Nocardia alni]